MIRTILTALTIGLYLIVTYPVQLFLRATRGTHKERNDRIASRMIRGVLRIMIKIAGIRLTVTGKENIPDEPVLYVGNHRSYFDIVTTYVAIDTVCGYVAKIEMGRFPIFNKWMELLNCLLLDRSDIKQGLKTILSGIEQVKNGISIFIFPEGTRSQTDEMLEFKEGSLKIADKSGCAIIPVAIKGTDNVWEKHVPFIRPAEVHIHFGEPIYPKQLSRDEKKFLGASVRDRIQKTLDEMDEE